MRREIRTLKRSDTLMERSDRHSSQLRDADLSAHINLMYKIYWPLWETNALMLGTNCTISTYWNHLTYITVKITMQKLLPSWCTYPTSIQETFWNYLWICKQVWGFWKLVCMCLFFVIGQNQSCVQYKHQRSDCPEHVLRSQLTQKTMKLHNE